MLVYKDRGETIIKKTLQVTILTGIVVELLFLKTTAGKNTYMVSPSYLIHISSVNYPPGSHEPQYNGN